MLLALLLSLACAPTDGKPDTSGDDSGASAILGPDLVTLDDTEEGLVVTIEGGDALAWLYGVIDPGLDYTAEGCRDATDTCHTLGPTGGTIAWGDCDTPTDGTTCIAQVSWRQGVLSHVVRPSTAIGCWAWGEDADYWTDCTETAWAPGSS